jgi:hypothetical protein
MESDSKDTHDSFSRRVYQTIIPKSIRSRLGNTPIVQGLRDAHFGPNGSVPYVLLGEQHIANLKVVTNRNALLCSLPKNGVAAEIGVFEGEFSRRILKYAQPQKLHLIDVWGSERYPGSLMDVVKEKFKTKLADGSMEINRGYSTDELAKFPDHYFDWVYVDTDHSYETTAKELELCRMKVKKGGIIAGHDYVQGDWKLRYRYGVVEAVNEFCQKYDWEMILTTYETHRHLSYALREIGSFAPNLNGTR